MEYSNEIHFQKKTVLIVCTPQGNRLSQRLILISMDAEGVINFNFSKLMILFRNQFFYILSFLLGSFYLP